MPGEKFIHSGVQMPDSGASVVLDVLAPGGARLCQLILYRWQDGSGGTVDVLVADDQMLTPMAWHTGTEVLRQELPPGTPATVDIKKVST